VEDVCGGARLALADQIHDLFEEGEVIQAMEPLGQFLQVPGIMGGNNSVQILCRHETGQREVVAEMPNPIDVDQGQHHQRRPYEKDGYWVGHRGDPIG
jgi:hypothetical protein